MSRWLVTRKRFKEPLMSEKDVKYWANYWNKVIHEKFPEEYERMQEAPMWGLDEHGSRLVISGLTWHAFSEDSQRSYRWWTTRPVMEVEASLAVLFKRYYLRWREAIAANEGKFEEDWSDRLQEILTFIHKKNTEEPTPTRTDTWQQRSRKRPYPLYTLKQNPIIQKERAEAGRLYPQLGRWPDVPTAPPAPPTKRRRMQGDVEIESDESLPDLE